MKKILAFLIWVIPVLSVCHTVENIRPADLPVAVSDTLKKEIGDYRLRSIRTLDREGKTVYVIQAQVRYQTFPKGVRKCHKPPVEALHSA